MSWQLCHCDVIFRACQADSGQASVLIERCYLLRLWMGNWMIHQRSNVKVGGNEAGDKKYSAQCKKLLIFHLTCTFALFHFLDGALFILKGLVYFSKMWGSVHRSSELQVGLCLVNRSEGRGLRIRKTFEEKNKLSGLSWIWWCGPIMWAHLLLGFSLVGQI